MTLRYTFDMLEDLLMPVKKIMVYMRKKKSTTPRTMKARSMAIQLYDANYKWTSIKYFCKATKEYSEMFSMTEVFMQVSNHVFLVTS